MSRSVEASSGRAPGSRSPAQPGSVRSNYAPGTGTLPGSIDVRFTRSPSAVSSKRWSRMPIDQVPSVSLDTLLGPAGLTLSRVAEPSETTRANAVLEENCNTRITTAETEVQRRLQAEERFRDEQRRRQSASALAECQSQATQQAAQLQGRISTLETQVREQRSDLDRQLALANDATQRTSRALEEAQRQLLVQTAALQQAEEALSNSRRQLQAEQTTLAQTRATYEQTSAEEKQALQGLRAELAQARASAATATTTATLSTDASAVLARNLTEELAAAQRRQSECETRAATATAEAKRLRESLAEQRSQMLAECKSRITQQEAQLQAEIRVLQAQKSESDGKLALVIDANQKTSRALEEAKGQLQVQTVALQQAEQASLNSRRQVEEEKTRQARTQATYEQTIAERDQTLQALRAELAEVQASAAKAIASASESTSTSALTKQSLVSQREEAQRQQSEWETKVATATAEAKLLRESLAEVVQRHEAEQRFRAACESRATESMQREAELNRQLFALREASQRQQAEAERRLAAAATITATETAALTDTKRLLQDQVAALLAERERNIQRAEFVDKQLAETKTGLSSCEAKASSATEETKRLSAQLAARATELETVRRMLEQEARAKELYAGGNINELKHIIWGAKLAMQTVWNRLSADDRERTKKIIENTWSGEELVDSLAWIALIESLDPAVWDSLKPLTPLSIPS